MPAEKQKSDRPMIVAVGASAGGVQALQQLFGALPDNTGAAFVVVIHLDPEHRSELAQILQTGTRMRVTQVEGREQLEANHVYVIPPDRRLQLVDHEISAVDFDEPRGHRHAIDLFFRSLAERLGDGFAVILSGAGSDGAVGVRAVKGSGGIILVQDPNEAEYSSMPRSAIATGVADFVLPIEELVARLAALIAIKRSGAGTEAPLSDDDLLRRLLAHLRIRTGHDFSKYKRSTVVRRIARRMQVARTESLQEYYGLLRENADEAHALLGDLLISVTTFFRDGEPFELLKKLAISKLLENRNPADAVRIWVAGCATGEEAYSVAMLLLEEASRYDLLPAIQVFGSDLDVRALATAREGHYPAAIEADVSEERLRRFFSREGDGYRVRQEVRETVLFAVHDLLRDPPFSRVDMITCRNVLIYLDRDLQEQVCGTFHYALKPKGFLLLGTSESADYPTGLFRAIDRAARIYQAAPQTGDKMRLPPHLLRPSGVREQIAPFGRRADPSAAPTEAARHHDAMERFAPPSILVDESNRVMHLSANAGRFIAPSGGTLSGDVVDLVRQELRFDLRAALHRAFEQNEATLSPAIPVRFNGAPHRVHLLIKAVPREPSAAEAPQAVIMFIEGGVVDDPGGGEHPAADDTVDRLKEELELIRSRLRTLQEESETSDEELRAANEELQSINEEYRSTSEELETSKEELQSLNEELQTVNSELKLKLEAISRAHSDLQNLMAATDFGTLFLDPSLRIKRFTDRVTELFSITASDEGRPITDFAHQLEYDDFIRDARNVLSDLAPVGREVHSRRGRWYEMRMRPYHTIDDKIDGVVIAFVDITDMREIDQALRAANLQLRQQRRLVELSRAPMVLWELDGTIVEWNRGAEELYGFTAAEAIGRRNLGLFDLDPAEFERMRSQLTKTGSWSGECGYRAKDGRKLVVESRLQLETFDGHPLVLESTQDITERKAFDERQRMLFRELDHRIKNTLTVVQAVAHQTLRTSPSPGAFVERFDGRLEALAGAHKFLTQSEWHGADLRALVQEQLSTYLVDGGRRLHVEGPVVLLPADLAMPFALVLHELATNAAKYGALSRPTGSVRVTWNLAAASSRTLDFSWEEQGGPPVAAPDTEGLGTALIEGALTNATVTREFRPNGLFCRVVLPLPAADER